MDIRKLQRVIVDGLEGVKAQNILVFNTEHLSSLFERVVIASGTSNRQTKSLASSVREAVKSGGFPVPRIEGEANGEWIIVDCGAAVVHVMQPVIREYYHLEEIWGGKLVKMKLDDVSPKLVKASEPAAAPAKKRAAAKAPASRAPAKKVPAAKPQPKAGPAGKVAAKNVPVKKTAALKPAAKVVVGKAAPRPAAKKAAAPASRVVTRVVGYKAPSKKAEGGKAGVSRVATKRAPVRSPAPARKVAAKKAPRRA